MHIQQAILGFIARDLGTRVGVFWAVVRQHFQYIPYRSDLPSKEGCTWSRESATKLYQFDSCDGVFVILGKIEVAQSFWFGKIRDVVDFNTIIDRFLEN